MNKIEIPNFLKKLSDEQLEAINSKIVSGEMKIYGSVEGKSEVKEILLQSEKTKRIYEYRKLIEEKRNLLINAPKPVRINLLLSINYYLEKIEELKSYNALSASEYDGPNQAKKNLIVLSYLTYKNE